VTVACGSADVAREGSPGAVEVICRATPDGFACDVVVGRDPGATRHSVSISQADLARLAPGHADPQALVEASFAFLLAREARESILPRFALPAIERYFPGYEAEMRRSMTSPPSTTMREP
jgi:hypothetical protein